MTKEATLTVVAFNGAYSVKVNFEESRERILGYHENNLRACQQQFGYQFLAGLELGRVKDALPHGQFMKWREENLPALPERTAQLYLAFAQELISKSATVADLASKPLQLSNGEIPEREKRVILDAVFEFADGRSLTELYRDLGVIRPKKEPEYHPPKDLTAEEKARAEEDQARELIQSAIVALRLTLDDKTKADSQRPDRKELIDMCIEVSKAYKALDRKKSKAALLTPAARANLTARQRARWAAAKAKGGAK
jgi:hypothetical protein